jgi:hypothetical protein
MRNDLSDRKNTLEEGFVENTHRGMGKHREREYTRDPSESHHRDDEQGPTREDGCSQQVVIELPQLHQKQ